MLFNYQGERTNERTQGECVIRRTWNINMKALEMKATWQIFCSMGASIFEK